MVSVTGGQGKVENYILQNTTADFRIQNADMSGSITIIGNNVFQQTLTANTSGIVPTGCSLRYQWYSATYSTTSGGTVISGATSSTYTVPKNMIGRYIYVVVTASKANYNSKTFSDVTDASNNKYAAVVCEHTYADATCTVPKTCTKCGATSGSALGHNWSGATCTTDNTCTRCGAWGSGALGHDTRDATCTEPERCVRCGTTWGSKLGHNYRSATCTSPKKCRRCGATSGSALGHNFNSPTCYSYATCSRCGTKGASPLGHWGGKKGGLIKPATCITGAMYYDICIRCGNTLGTMTVGSGLGHSYGSATCTNPKKCSRCGATSGSALGHNWKKSGKKYKCSRCGRTVASM